MTLVAAVAALPLAAVWGIGHAEVEDYLGPHRVHFASNFSGEVEIDLGPIGNAYLTSPVRPIGVDDHRRRGRVGGGDGWLALLRADTGRVHRPLRRPEEAVAGIVERLEADAVSAGSRSKPFCCWPSRLFKLRGRLLAPWVVPRLTRRRTVAAYLVVLALIVGSILVPKGPRGCADPG